jgi:hypothetical protein
MPLLTGLPGLLLLLWLLLELQILLAWLLPTELLLLLFEELLLLLLAGLLLLLLAGLLSLLLKWQLSLLIGLQMLPAWLLALLLLGLLLSLSSARPPCYVFAVVASRWLGACCFLCAQARKIGTLEVAD